MSFFVDPGFWRLQDKIGMALDDIHITGNVPQCESHAALFGLLFPFRFIFVFVFRFAVSVCGFGLGRSISTVSVPSWRHRHLAFGPRSEIGFYPFPFSVSLRYLALFNYPGPLHRGYPLRVGTHG